MPPDPRRARELFHAVLDLPAGERAAFLAGQCEGDPELLARVQALLAAAADPAPDLDATAGFAAPTDAHESAVAAGAVVAGRYKLVEPIGEGGMGTVWLAQQQEPVKRKVAVKLIKAGMDSRQVLARFEAERQALALMDHPNIAKVLDGGIHDGRPFFVMELVKGVPITDYCDARKLTPRERLELFVPVCQAIQHAHQKGVIHRDVKPSNVLVALYDDRPVPKVIDFGIAKATGAQLTDQTIDTGFGGVVGTPQYMSPEQATLNNLDIDTRSDVYSLGVLLYELLAGSPPFARDELQRAGLLEVLRVVREEEPPRPSAKLSTADAVAALSANRGTEPRKLAGLLRSELDWIVMKALEKDRTRRYETANGFAADVGRYLAGEAVLAHPPGAGYRARKFLRKHRAAVGTAAAFACVLLTAAAACGWLAVHAEQQRRLAVSAAGDARDQRDAADTARRAADERKREAERTAASLAVDLDLHELENDKRVGLLRLARRHGQIPADSTALREFAATAVLTAGQEFALLLPPRRTPDGTEPDQSLMSPDGRAVLSWGKRQPARAWDVRTGRARVLQQGGEVVDRGGWADGGRTAYTGALDGAVRFWDAASGALTAATGQQPDRSNPPLAPEGRKDWCQVAGRRLLAFGKLEFPESSNKFRQSADLWDTGSGRLVARLDLPQGGAGQVKFVGERWIVAEDRGFRSWWVFSADTGARVAQLASGRTTTHDRLTVCVNPAGTRLATESAGGRDDPGYGALVREWDTTTWKPTGGPIHIDDDRLDRYLTDELIVTSDEENRSCRLFCTRRRTQQAWGYGGDPALLPGGLFERDGGRVLDIATGRRLPEPVGRRYHPELARGAVGGRYYGRIDLAADKLIPGSIPTECHVAGLGFVAVSGPGVAFVPTSAPPIPTAALELWAQVAARGELGPDGAFVKWDEPTWRQKWRELAAVEPPRAEFPFPGHLATDRSHWLSP